MLIDTPQLTPSAGAAAAGYPAPQLDIVIPVYNEERVLRHSVLRLYRHLASSMRDIDFRITIADNASNDRTPAIATALARELPLVCSLRLADKGRGRALRAAWSGSDAAVVAYMDVDLSTDLRCLRALVEPLLAGEADVAIGTRLARGAVVTRGVKRELISRSYNRLLHLCLGVAFSDAQCGFKAVRRASADRLLPMIENENWFFDTELLVLAEREGMTIHEVPVRWEDDPDSRVDIRATALEDLRGIRRLRRRRRGASGHPAADTALRAS
jgi:glycosyltransferase involved in cell wall biosynthesis